MNAQVSIIMGSTSDLPVMKKAADFLNDMEIPFEMLALSAHRTPDEVADFAREAQARGIKVIIAGAGMAAALPGVIAAITPLPVIGVPLSATLQGQDALLSIAQMPPGIPVATTGIDGAMNAAVLATRILALADENLATRYNAWRSNLGKNRKGKCRPARDSLRFQNQLIPTHVNQQPPPNERFSTTTAAPHPPPALVMCL